MEHAPRRLDTHRLAFEVHSRRGRLLLALRAAKAAAALVGATHPLAHALVVRAALAIRAAAAAQQQRQQGAEVANGGGGSSTNGAALEVATQQATALLGGASPEAYHERWAAKHGGASLQHRTVAAELSALLAPGSAAEVAARLVAGGCAGASHKQAVAVHELLLDRMRQPEAAEAWRAAAAQVFRLSRYFGGPDLLPLPAQAPATEGEAGMANGLSHDVAALKL